MCSAAALAALAVEALSSWPVALAGKALAVAGNATLALAAVPGAVPVDEALRPGLLLYRLHMELVTQVAAGRFASVPAVPGA